MAIVQVPEASRLVIVFQDGTDDMGRPKTVTKSFSNVRADATDASVYGVAVAIAQLQTRTVLSINRHDRAELLDDGQ